MNQKPRCGNLVAMVTREKVRVGEGTVTPSGSQHGLPHPPSPLRARVGAEDTVS